MLAVRRTAWANFMAQETVILNRITKLQEKIKTMLYSLSEINQPKFRVPEIDTMWNIYFESYKHELTGLKPIIKKYRAKVSSGTYIRSLSNQIGNEIGCGAIALDIHRTQIFDN